jgi:transcriptional regulator with XRE-family HTH domain
MTADTSPDPLSLALGRAIRAARDQAGMSMRALAMRCGVSQPFLSEVERGRSTPSIATLHRIAEALSLSPASLLPGPAADPVVVVRHHEGRRVPSSDRPRSAIGRVVFSDEDRHLEVYEYVTSAAEDLDVWFEHPGEKVLHLIEGRLAVEFDGRPPEHLGPGDCIVHPGTIAHRWVVEGDEPVRLFLVVVRP